MYKFNWINFSGVSTRKYTTGSIAISIIFVQSIYGLTKIGIL